MGLQARSEKELEVLVKSLKEFLEEDNHGFVFKYLGVIQVLVYREEYISQTIEKIKELNLHIEGDPQFVQGEGWHIDVFDRPSDVKHSKDRAKSMSASEGVDFTQGWGE